MIPGYIFFQIILFSMLLWARAELLRFLREHTGIYDDAMLSKYKVVVRRNMLAALAFLVSGLILMAWGFYLSLKYGLTGFSIALVFSIPAFYLGFGAKKIESRARSLECSDPALKEEYKRISEVWVKRALPNF